MFIYIYVCIHMCIHMHMCVHTYVHAHTHTRVELLNQRASTCLTFEEMSNSFTKCQYAFSLPHHESSPYPPQYLILLLFLIGMELECDKPGKISPRIHWKILDTVRREFPATLYFLIIKWILENQLKSQYWKKVFFFLFLFLTNFILTQIHSELHLVIKFSQVYPTFFHWPPKRLN